MSFNNDRNFGRRLHVVMHTQLAINQVRNEHKNSNGNYVARKEAKKRVAGDSTVNLVDKRTILVHANNERRLY